MEISFTTNDITCDDIAEQICLSSLANEIEVSEIADQIDTSDIANQIDLDELADEINKRDVASFIDVRSLAKEIDYEKLTSHIIAEKEIRDDLLHVHSAGQKVAQQYPMLDCPTAMFEAMTEAISSVAMDTCSEDPAARRCGEIRMLGMLSVLAQCLDGTMAAFRNSIEARPVSVATVENDLG